MFCAVRNCSTKSGGLYSLHCFPKKESLQIEWLKRCGHSSWTQDELKKISRQRICSKHFQDNDYTNECNSLGAVRRKLILRPNAIPSLFLGEEKSVPDSPGFKNAEMKFQNQTKLIKLLQAQVQNIEMELAKARSELRCWKILNKVAYPDEIEEETAIKQTTPLKRLRKFGPKPVT